MPFIGNNSCPKTYTLVYIYSESSFVEILFTQSAQSEQHVGKLMWLPLSEYLILDNNKWKVIAFYTLQ